MKWSTWHKCGTKKKPESLMGIKPIHEWPPKHRAWGLSTEPQELMESKAIKLSSCMTRVLHTARSNNVEVVIVNDNEMMANFKLSDKVIKMTASTLLLLAVCRTCVIHELSLTTSLSMSSCGSVNRAPAWCLRGLGFDSRRGLPSGPTLVSSWLFHLSFCIILYKMTMSALVVQWHLTVAS